LQRIASTPASRAKPYRYTDRNAQLRALLDDIRGLDALFAHAGIPMDTLSAAKRAAWITEYNTIRQEVQP